jgi:cytochrome c553
MFPRHPVKELVMADLPQRFVAASPPAMYLVERYIERQLYAFRSGERCNDEGEQTRVITAKLMDAEISDLAVFLSSGKQ